MAASTPDLVEKLGPGNPPGVVVILAGERKDFGFSRPNDVKLAFDLLDARFGRRTLPITAHNVSFPEGLELADIEPRQVQIQISENPATNGAITIKP